MSGATTSGMIATAAGTVLALGALPPLLASGYLGGLALLARQSPPWRPGTSTRFCVVVPAHDEEAGIGRTVESLLALDYPRERFRVLVVADNCSDATADVARRAGATVIERHDDERRGKGHALAHAFPIVLADGFADAAVVVDADTVVAPNLLSAMAARIEAGELAVQAHYGVRNAADSWRTRLMALAFTLFHGVRSLGRERLRLSCGLRGNGMAFTRTALERAPYAAFSIVEDLEYGIQLARAGVRVAYAAEAEVLGDMPASERASRSQRDRWELGRRSFRAHARALLRAGIARRDPMLLDLAADVLVPPLAQLATVVLLGVVGSLVALWLAIPGAVVGAALWCASLVGLLVYGARGCTLSGLGMRTVGDLAWAPVYVAWKLARRLRPDRSTPAEWVRTSRATDR